LIEIRRILVLGIDVWGPYEVDEFFYMFTGKEGLGEKLMAFMNLPTGDNHPITFMSLTSV
jgi:hypothetical protein